MDKEIKIKHIMELYEGLGETEKKMLFSFICGLYVASTGKHVKDIIKNKDLKNE